MHCLAHVGAVQALGAVLAVGRVRGGGRVPELGVHVGGGSVHVGGGGCRCGVGHWRTKCPGLASGAAIIRVAFAFVIDVLYIFSKSFSSHCSHCLCLKKEGGQERC